MADWICYTAKGDCSQTVMHNPAVVREAAAGSRNSDNFFGRILQARSSTASGMINPVIPIERQDKKKLESGMAKLLSEVLMKCSSCPVDR